jgi:hypothetical protein
MKGYVFMCLPVTDISSSITVLFVVVWRNIDKHNLHINGWHALDSLLLLLLLFKSFFS